MEDTNNDVDKGGASWLHRLQRLLDAHSEASVPLHGSETDEIFLRTLAVQLLSDLVQPPISIVAEKVHVPDAYVVNIDGGRTLLQIFFSELFGDLPDELQIILLDVLFATLKRSIYDVVRFRCFGSIKESNGGFVRVLISLLQSKRANIPIAQRLIRLIGVVALGGISIHDFKDMLKLLRKPSELSLSVLQGLKAAVRSDDADRKASPNAFFNLGGHGSGLFLPGSEWPFPREYQISFWFRIEGQVVATLDQVEAVHLFTCMNLAGQGVDIQLIGNRLRVSISNGEDSRVYDPQSTELHSGIWYHLHVLHNKPKMSIFRRDLLIVQIDHKNVISENVALPVAAKMGEVAEFSIGRNFNGQIGTVWISQDALSDQTIVSLAKNDANRGVDASKLLGGVGPPDVNPAAAGEKKSLAPKLLAVFHASRCAQHHALDIHGGRHARFGRLTQAWTLIGGREIISSIGGISAILPILPRLLVENHEVRALIAQKTLARFANIRIRLPSGAEIPLSEQYNLRLGLGNPLAALFDDRNSLRHLHPSTQQIMLQDRDEYKEDTPISMLLSIIGRCFRAHPANQNELLQSGGVDMLEYVLYCLPHEIIRAEGMPTIMAVIRLRGAATGNDQLEALITRRIFGNFKIWTRATPKLQRDLMAIVVATLRSDPGRFIDVLDVQMLMDTLIEFFMHDVPLQPQVESKETETVPPPPLDRSSSEDVRDTFAAEDSALHTPTNRRRSAFLTRINSKRRSLSVAQVRMSESDTKDDTSRPSIDLGHAALVDENDLNLVEPESVFAACQERKLSDPQDLLQFISDQGSVHLLRDSDHTSDADLARSIMSGSITGEEYPYPQPEHTLLTQDDRKYLRGCILSMVMALIKHRPTDKTLQPLVFMMCDCTDEVVLNEMAQLLLFTLTSEPGELAVLQSLTNILGNPMQVVAFILHRLIQRASEDLRCTGIRLLTHYASRMDRVPGVAAFRRGTLRQFGRHERAEGIEWLGHCGALQLLAQYLIVFRDMCTEKTYASLLEMLVTKPGGPLNYQHVEGADEGLSAEDLTASTEFAVAELNPHTVMDENQDMTNPAVLSVFFEILAMLPMSVQEKIYSDLLLLLKHSKRNKESFASHRQWQHCLFGLVSQLMVVNEEKPSNSLQQLILSEESNDREATNANATQLNLDSNTQLTAWFDIGMKIFGLLVVHKLQEGNDGVGELRKALTFSLQDVVGRGVSLAVLSHVINEYRFAISFILSDLQRLSSTPTQADFIQAKAKVLTMLSAVTDAGFVAIGEPVATRNVTGLEMGRTRLALVDDAISEFANTRCNFQCDEISHETCMLSMNNCPDCGHAWVVHPAAPNVMDLVEAKLASNRMPTATDEPYRRSDRPTKVSWLVVKSSANILEPLQRGFDISSGNLTVILQMLHLFDAIFLPNIDQPIRNGKLLEHASDCTKCTVFMATMRMILFVLQELAPTHDQALQNVKRLRRLMSYISQIPAEVVSRQEWVLVVLTHILEHMQRLYTVVKGVGPHDNDSLSALHARLLVTAGQPGIAPVALKTVEVISQLDAVVDEMFNLLTDLVDNFPEILSEAVRRKPFSSLALFITERKYAEQVEQKAQEDATPLDLLQSVEPLLSRTMQWLSTLAIRVDMMKSESAIRAIDYVDEQEKIMLAALTSQLRELQTTSMSHRPSHANFDTDEMEELQMLATKVIQSVSTKEINREAATAAAFETQLRVAASHWQKCLRQMSAEWSPWADENLATRWKLSKHTDNKLRRILLVHNFDFQSHDDAAYQDRGEKFEQLPKLDQSLGNLEVQDITKEISHVTSDELDAIPSRPGSTSFLKSSKDTILQNTTGTKRRDLDLPEEDDEMEEDHPHSAGDRRQYWAAVFGWLPDEKWITETEAQQITPGQNILGIFVVSNRHVYFQPRKRQTDTLGSSKPLKDRRWRFDRFTEMHGRRYLLQNCALELFFADSAGVFFAFNSLKVRDFVFRAILRQSRPLMRQDPSLKPRYVFMYSRWTEEWRQRKISNFEYLMRLNTIAGRSFNDITQYPVFPWVLADYTSETIDLADPSVYRDLRLPVGAINPSRLEEFLDRYEEFDDPHVPKFMYGSHYSSAGVVLHYMLRQEPFSSLAINFQGGRFDCPDRLFFDLAASWESCKRSMSDVKELIPEMFCCPEILINSNKFQLGTLQDERGTVDNVRLPPWAKDPYDFIRIHREALESEYVSQNLHHWIDLIFGFKQRGEAAVEAHNVFYYLTYEGAVDIDKIEDPIQREATKAQVTHFGQTPTQLTSRPHPSRLPREDCTMAMCSAVSKLSDIRVYYPHKQLLLDSTEEYSAHGPVLTIRCAHDKLTIVHADLTVRTFRWISYPDAEGRPFQIRPDKQRQLPSSHLSVSHHVIRKLTRFGGHIPSKMNNIKPFQPSTPEPMSPSQVSAIEHMDGSTAPTRPQSLKRSSDSSVSQTDIKPRSALSKGLKSIGGFFGSRPHAQSLPTHLESAEQDIDRFASAEQKTGNEEQDAAAYLSKTDSILQSRRKTNKQEVTDSGYFAGAHATGVGPWSIGVAIQQDPSRSKIISCGYWDHSVKCHLLESGREADSVDGVHVSNVRCIDYGVDKNVLITGGQDGTCRVWVVDHPVMAAALSSKSPADSSVEVHEKGNAIQCVHTLYGHDSSVTALSHSRDLDLVLSGSESGLLCVHSARKGKFIRNITDLLGNCVDIVLLSTSGYIIAHSWTNEVLYVFSINGKLLAEASATQRLCCMITNVAGTVLVCGGEAGALYFRNVHDLEQLHMMDLSANGSIRSLWFADDDQYLFVGFEDGTFAVCADPAVRMKMIQVSIQNTPLLGPSL